MRKHHLLIAPIAALVLFFSLSQFNLSTSAAATAAITLLTAWWWATEAIPIPATSLIPFILLPSAGVISHKQAAAGLGSHIILLMLGGFIMAKALERVLARTGVLQFQFYVRSVNAITRVWYLHL